jgi:hypothetical protein
VQAGGLLRVRASEPVDQEDLVLFFALAGLDGVHGAITDSELRLTVPHRETVKRKSVTFCKSVIL